jgi:hypothetical protein
VATTIAGREDTDAKLFAFGRTNMVRKLVDLTGKYTLGAALIALAESGKGEPLVTNFKRWLDHYLSRPQDRDIFTGTAFTLVPGSDDHEHR